jgi:hypothetical protein
MARLPPKIRPTVTPLSEDRAFGGDGLVRPVGSLVVSTGGAPSGAGLGGHFPNQASQRPSSEKGPPIVKPPRSALFDKSLRTARHREIRGRLGKSLGLKATYSPTNAALYACAFDGALAGMFDGRIPLGTLLSSYATQVTVAAVWAQTVDTTFDLTLPIDQPTAEIVYGQSYAVFAGRSASTLTVAQVTPLAEAVYATVFDAELEFLAQGITPPLFQATSYVASATGGSQNLSSGGVSVVGGGVLVTAHGGTFVIQFGGQANWASGQQNTNIVYSLLL